MTEYMYNNKIMRVKSTEKIPKMTTVTITQEYPDITTTTDYSIERLIKKEQSRGFYYAWFEAVPIKSTSKDKRVAELMEQEDVVLDVLADQEYRICMLELFGGDEL